MKGKLIEILKEKELTLKEIYLAMPEYKQASIRAVLNSAVKKGNTFVRTNKATYKFKQE